MDFAAKKWAVEQPIKGMARFVLIMLAARVNGDRICWPKIRTIARDVGATERTVQRALRTLEATGLIETIPQYGPHGGHIHNKYRLLVSETKASPPERRNVIPLPTLRHQPGDTDVTPTTTTIECSYETPLQQRDQCAGLVLPSGLSNEEKAETLRIVESFNQEIAQQLLDEFAGMRNRGTFRISAISWLRGLAKRAKAGEFRPSLAIEVSKRRERWIREPIPEIGRPTPTSLSGGKAIQEIQRILKRNT